MGTVQKRQCTRFSGGAPSTCTPGGRGHGSGPAASRAGALPDLAREHVDQEENAPVEQLAHAIEQLRHDIHRMATHIGLISHGLALRRAAKDASEDPAPAVASKPRAASELPRWIGLKDVKTKIGLTPAQLKKLSRLGYVRAAKLGESRQSACLYNTVDILEALDRTAAGYEPRKKRKAP